MRLIIGSATLLLASSLCAQDRIAVPPQLVHKIASGKLLDQVSAQSLRARKGLLKSTAATTSVILYLHDYPDLAQLQSMESLGIQCHWETWTPPLPGHPDGLVVATLPVGSFIDALGLDFVTRMGTAEMKRSPKNNLAARSVHADSVWAKGWTGSGARVAVLDSGLDTENPDLPSPIVAKDYSHYPDSIGTSVTNMVTGHGTHVTGTVLGRGVLSSANAGGNGAGSFQGMAPGAGLIFLKIGDDSTASSTTPVDIAAMHAAVDTFHANVLTMSYGGWDAFHDGTDPEDQVVDWVYSRGVPFFIAAGNEADANRHYSGNVGAFDSTGFIVVSVNGASTNSTQLSFNLIWTAAPAESTSAVLELRFYDNAQKRLAVTPDSQTWSPRGTHSEYATDPNYVPSGSSVYYLKVVNHSSTALTFHIFEDWDDGTVEFANPDPAYTIDEPASADHACAVAAYVSRNLWAPYDGGLLSTSESVGDVTTYSSRGPRVDGTLKPDIAAPGSVLISVRDRQVFNLPDENWVASNGVAGSDTAYYVMEGTSMATPVASGSAALLLGRAPSLSPQQVYDAMASGAIMDNFTGTVPNPTWGHGKLNINAAIEGVTSVSTGRTMPGQFSLRQNYPNPFNPSTVIRYGLPRAVQVSLVVYDILGRQVAVLASGFQQAGSHEIVFNAAGLASGVYFYRLRAGDFVQAKKLVVMR